MICEEVEMIGFDCSLISITEMKGENQLAKKKEKQQRQRLDTHSSNGGMS
jgi:hypothetical protein